MKWENRKMIRIIMPVYNSEKYVSEAIDSVYNQSYENCELLIVNDGSSDHSAEIINEYTRKDSRIKVGDNWCLTVCPARA